MSNTITKKRFNALITLDSEGTSKLVTEALAKKGKKYKGAVLFHRNKDGSEIAIKQMGLSRLEAMIMKKYKHNNILPLQDIGETKTEWTGRYPKNTKNGYTVIVMPKVQCSVRQIIFETYPWQLWISLFLDACEGMHYLFNGDRRVHVLHQDFKSDNIFMTSDFRAMVADFDMSAIVDSFQYARHKCARARAGCGTIGHCDPFTLRARSITCELTEAYSMGIVLLEAMIGVPGSALPVWSIPQYYVKRAVLRGWPENVAMSVACLGLAATHPTRTKRISLCVIKSHLEALYLYTYDLAPCPSPVNIPGDPWDGIAVVGSRIMNLAEATSWTQVAVAKADMLKRPWCIHVPLYAGLDVPPGDDKIYGEESLKSPEIDVNNFRPPSISFDDPEEYQCALLFPKGPNSPMEPVQCACGQLRPRLGITQALMPKLKTENRTPIQVADLSKGTLKELPAARSGYVADSEGTVNNGDAARIEVDNWSLTGMFNKWFGACGGGNAHSAAAAARRNMVMPVIEQVKAGGGRQAPLTATSVIQAANTAVKSPNNTYWNNLYTQAQAEAKMKEMGSGGTITTTTTKTSNPPRFASIPINNNNNTTTAIPIKTLITSGNATTITVNSDGTKGKVFSSKDVMAAGADGFKITSAAVVIPGGDAFKQQQNNGGMQFTFMNGNGEATTTAAGLSPMGSPHCNTMENLLNSPVVQQ